MRLSPQNSYRTRRPGQQTPKAVGRWLGKHATTMMIDDSDDILLSIYVVRISAEVHSDTNSQAAFET